MTTHMIQLYSLYFVSDESDVSMRRENTHRHVVHPIHAIEVRTRSGIVLTWYQTILRICQ